MSGDYKEFCVSGTADDICSIRMRYNLPCQDCVYASTHYCTKRRRKKKDGNSKREKRRAEL